MAGSSAAQKRQKVRAGSERGPAVAITVEGKTYVIVSRDMTAADVRELRVQAGLSYNRLIRTGQTDMDVDVLATFVWLARRIAGERSLRLSTVMDQMGWTDDYHLSDDEDVLAKAIEDRDAEEDPAHPEV